MQAFWAMVVAVSLAGAPDPRALDPQAVQAVPAPQGAAVPTPAMPTPAGPPAKPTGGSSPAMVGPARPQPVVDKPPPPPVASKCLTTPGRCRRLGIAGIVSVTLGAGTIGVAAGLLATPNEPIEGEPAFERSVKPVGAALLALGIGTLVVGAMMLIAGHRAHKRRQLAGRR